MPKVSEEHRAARRRQILDAAWRCLAGRGYRDLTVDDVCAAAGLSKGAFYGYFETKQDLLVALVAEEASALDDVAAELRRSDRSGAERVRRLALAGLRGGDHAIRVQLRADLWAELPGDARVRERFRGAVARRRLLRAAFSESVASGDLRLEPGQENALASIVLALSDGLMLHKALDPGAFRWENVEAVLDRLLDGVDGTS